MLPVEAMVSEWRALYGEWCSAEFELRHRRQAPDRDPSTFEALATRAALLEQRCKSALDEIDAALAATSAPVPISSERRTQRHAPSVELRSS
jgi:hypothetical protein